MNNWMKIPVLILAILGLLVALVLLGSWLITTATVGPVWTNPLAWLVGFGIFALVVALAALLVARLRTRPEPPERHP